MKKKYIWFNILLTALALLAFLGFGISVTRRNHYAEAEKKIVEITEIYVHQYTDPSVTAQKLSDEIRITVIDATGAVLADSESVDVSSLGNHLDREELLAALEGKPRTVIRKSETLGVDMVYYAEKAETTDGYVFIRVAVPVQSARSYVLLTLPLMLIVLLGVLLVATVASVLFSLRLLDPIKKIGQNLRQVKNGVYHPMLPDTGDDEINSVVQEINELSKTLQDTIQNAESEKTRLDYILDHISDGIVALDCESGNITLCNKAASAIFAVSSPIDRHYSCLTANPDWNESIGRFLSGTADQNGEFATESKVFTYTMRRLANGIAVIVLTDITAEHESARLRSEFFANASHELKTPLTAIKGFNEIVGMKTEDEEIRDYSRRIGKEADRMISLIGDMLDLSRLESGQKLHPEPVSLRSAAQEVADTLSPLAAEKQISLSVQGDATVSAEREHITELIKNLAENGVRYNRPDGHVCIGIREEDKTAVLTVADDGIGIDEKDQGRIFERFYRVSKSRSRETGGTGLGLAIVKHICSLYDAELSLRSKPGVGTEITVRFPRFS